MSDRNSSDTPAADGAGSVESGSGRTARSGGCPFHDSTGGTDSSGNERTNVEEPALMERAVDRRSFVRTALAIGGTGALAAVSDGVGANDSGLRSAEFDVPQGPTDPDAFPERQHAWNQDLKKDPFGNVVLPNHQVILFLDYVNDGIPTGADRQEVEAAFRTLELAFQRLSGGDPDGDNSGLVFMVGYSRSYFDRIGPEGNDVVDLVRTEVVLRRTDDDPAKADNYDAVLLLSSATVSVVLGAEAALFGNLETLNDVDVRGTLDGIFERADRRTAFVGKRRPRENLVEDAEGSLMDEEPETITDDAVRENLREDAPLSMGYKSGFKDNVATEDAVTISTGPFKEGTTFQVSRLELDLGRWYANDRSTRDQLMFSHEHSRDDIGDIGETLEDNSGITERIVSELEETAEQHGQVGHAAKTALARNEDFEPRILRRSEGVNNAFVDPEGGKVGFNFSAVMEDIEDFIVTRQAMNASHLDDDIEEGGHGILPYMEVTNRATFLVPPRKHRSLPLPRPVG